MIFKLTLTPNRATGPRRGIRLVAYRREGNRVVPWLYTESEGAPAECRALAYREIAPSQADPDFAAAWLEHVSSQGAVDPAAPRG